MKLLGLHHRHEKEADRLLEELAAKVTRRLERIVPTAPAAGTSSGTATTPGAAETSRWPALYAAAAIARDLPPRLREAIVERLPPALEEAFLAEVFSFDALPMLDSLTLQAVIRRVDKRTLAVALLGASDGHFRAVTSNMSTRAATMLREDMESLISAGDLKTRDVRAARNALSSVIRDVSRDVR